MSLEEVSRLLLALPRAAKRLLAIMVDASLCVSTVWFTFSLLAEKWVAIDHNVVLAMAISCFIALPIFIRLGLYRAIFRFSGSNALLRVAVSVLIYGVLYAGLFSVVGFLGVARSFGIVQPLLLLVAVVGIRSLAHYWLGQRYLYKIGKGDLPQVAIYGAGAAGRQLAAALGRATHESRLVAYIDDDRGLRGHSVDGCKVFHPDDMQLLIEELDVTDVLLAVPSTTRTRRNEILSLLRQFPVHVRTVPGLYDLAQRKVELSDVQELDVEDLLGREAVAPDSKLLNQNIRGHVVVVTGAGGSIGSELCRQILRCQPSKLLLVELSEFALYQIHRDLQSMQAESAELAAVELIPLLASVQNTARMSAIMRTWQPHTVYHAAAYKHVPLVEHNPAEGIRNNVWGTWSCAQAAMQSGVKNFVLISTDKAVRPTNIMGASKRLAEMVLQAMAAQNAIATQSAPTTFSMVRFGNVLGSSGSVVPLFREQIRKGGPITLTHQEITRFFMTIPEAAQLVIQAGAMGVGGDVFVLDMGHPVKIIDLARRMVELSGLSLKCPERPDGDIEVQVTGLRPGEKLYEELLIGDNPKPTQHPRIMKAHEDFWEWGRLGPVLQSLDEALSLNDVHRIRQFLSELVSGYQPSSDVVDWVHLEEHR